MLESAKIEPQMLHPDQVSGQIQPEKIWLRQKNEPANWYMRFKCYLDLGTKRSLRAAVSAQPTTSKATKGDKNQAEVSEKKLSDISVPGAWTRAAKVWNWKERAQAYDLAEQEKEAQKIRNMATSMPYASKAYRILQLNQTAHFLHMFLEPGIKVSSENINWFLSVVTRYQSILRDIDALMQGMDHDVTADACDSAAMGKVREEIEENKRKQAEEQQNGKLTSVEKELLRRGLPLKK